MQGRGVREPQPRRGRGAAAPTPGPGPGARHYREGCTTELTTSWGNCGECASWCGEEQTCREGACVDLDFDRRLVTFGGVQQDDLLDIAVGTDESVFVLFRFRDVIAFAGHGFVTPAAGSDLVLVKLDRAGTVLWAVATESAALEEARIAAAPEGGVYVAGAFSTPTRFAGRSVAVPGGAVVPYVARLDHRGSVMWLTEGLGAMAVLDVAHEHGTLALSVRAWEPARLGTLPVSTGTSVVWVGNTGTAFDAILVPTVDDEGLAVAITQTGAVAIAGRVAGALTIGDELPIESPTEGPVPFVAELDFVTGAPSWSRFVLGATSIAGISAHDGGVDLIGRGGPIVTIAERELDLRSADSGFLARLDATAVPTDLRPGSGDRIESLTQDDVILVDSSSVAAFPWPRWSRSLAPATIHAIASGERVFAAGGSFGTSTATIDDFPVVPSGSRDVFVWWLTVR